MTGYVLSPRAQADVEEIWNYTAGRWGAAQAELYVRQIQTVIQTVASDRSLGRACDFVRVEKLTTDMSTSSGLKDF